MSSVTMCVSVSNTLVSQLAVLLKPLSGLQRPAEPSNKSHLGTKSSTDLETRIINALQALLAKHYFFILYNILLCKVAGSKPEKFTEIPHYYMSSIINE